MLPEDNDWFDKIFDVLSPFTCVLDARGKVIKANRAALEMTGAAEEELVGQFIWKIPWPILSRQNRQLLHQIAVQAANGGMARNEMRVCECEQLKMMIDFSIKPLADTNGVVQLMVAEGRDITAYKRTKEALFQSKIRFKTIFEKAGAGIVIKGVDGKLLDCNPVFGAMLGYETGEILQLDYLKITHPLDRTLSQKLFDELVNGKRKSYIIDKRYIHKNGQPVWGRIAASLVPGPHRQAQFVIGLVENITEQKQIETELAELQHRLTQGREMERLRVAQDLHDGPLQEIIGVSFQVKALENAVDSNIDREQLQVIRDTLHQLAKSVRSICGELRPPTLVPFGLEKTILSHAEDFKTAHPEIEINLDLDHDGQTLSEPVRIALFRIYQEALYNILRHAHAQTIWVRFSITAEQSILEVQDNGVGFGIPNRWIKLARAGHLGLAGAVERAKEVGGNLEITSAPGQGTLIRAVIPLKDEANQILNEEAGV